MTDEQPETTERANTLNQAFSQLGENLKAAVQAAWESEERQRLQRDMAAGLADLERAVSEAAVELTRGPTGERLREDVEGLQARVRRGEIQDRVRDDLLAALHQVNAELEKAIRRWSDDEPEAAPSDAPGNDEPALPAESEEKA